MCSFRSHSVQGIEKDLFGDLAGAVIRGFLISMVFVFLGCQNRSSGEGTFFYENNNRPFGLHEPYDVDASTAVSLTDVDTALSDVNVQYIRIDQSELSFIPDRISNLGVRAVVILSPMSSSELQAIVARYKDQVKYWEIGNEPDDAYGSNPADYVALLESQYAVIKKEDPRAFVLLGGLAHGTKITSSSPGAVFLQAILDAGAGAYFDIFNFHAQGEEKDYTFLNDAVTVYRQILVSHGLAKPVWVTECSTYNGDPVDSDIVTNPTSSPVVWPFQSEQQQAAGLIKRYVYAGALGIDKLFWNLLVERHNYGGVANSYFDNVGLVHNSANDGDSAKKLVYFSFKKMTEILGGGEWSNVRTVEESSDGVHIYGIPLKGRTVYVIWWDQYAGSVRNVVISGLTGNSAMVTDSVPTVSSGSQVADYSTAFTSFTSIVSNGAVTVSVSDTPLYVEDLEPVSR